LPDLAQTAPAVIAALAVVFAQALHARFFHAAQQGVARAFLVRLASHAETCNAGGAVVTARSGRPERPQQDEPRKLANVHVTDLRKARPSALGDLNRYHALAARDDDLGALGAGVRSIGVSRRHDTTFADIDSRISRDFLKC
jgi:hypothetical protein